MLPFNIASYAALVHIVAKMCNLIPGDLVFSGGNTHIYTNHMEQCEEVLRREPKELCNLEITWPSNFENWPTETQLDWVTTSMSHKDFKLQGYKSHPAITAKMAV